MTQSNPEIVQLHDQFVDIFAKAKWKVEADFYDVVSVNSGTGIGVLVNGAEKDRHPAIAQTLANLLNEFGLKIELDAVQRVGVNEIELVIAPRE